MKQLKLDSSKKVLKKPKGAMPDLSIIVIALNEEKHILNCLKSLRTQDFSGVLEIILADGNSKDKTVEIAMPLVDGVIIEKRRNCAFERNAGSLLARAEIIAFCDSDSVAGKKWAESIVETFRNDRKKEIIGVFGASGLHDAGFLEKKLSLFLMRSFAKGMAIFGKASPANSNYAFKRKVWERLDGMNTEFNTCEDHEFFSRASKLGKIVYNPGMIVYTSARRVKKMGYLGFLKFQLSNIKKFYTEGKSSSAYENIR